MSESRRILPDAKLLTLLMTLAIMVAACAGEGSDPTGAPSADLSPLAPAADDRPLSAGIDGIELGSTQAEVVAAWGEPLSDSYGTLEYQDRGGYQKVQLMSSRRDHGDVIWRMTLSPGDERDKEQTMPALIDRFGPPLTDAAEAAMLRTVAVRTDSDTETLFRAGRYVYAVVRWDRVAEDRLVLSELDLVLHPHAVFDVPRSEWPQLRSPFPISLPDEVKAKLEELLASDGPDEVAAKEFERLLGPPTWEHPASLNREAWRYMFWDSQTDLEFYFSDGALNGYQTQGLD